MGHSSFISARCAYTMAAAATFGAAAWQNYLPHTASATGCPCHSGLLRARGGATDDRRLVPFGPFSCNTLPIALLLCVYNTRGAASGRIRLVSGFYGRLGFYVQFTCRSLRVAGVCTLRARPWLLRLRRHFVSVTGTPLLFSERR